MSNSVTNSTKIADIVLHVLDTLRTNAAEEFALLEKIGTFPTDWSMIRPENFIDTTTNTSWNTDSASYDLKDEPSGLTIRIGYDRDTWCSAIGDDGDMVWFQLLIGNHCIVSNEFALNATGDAIHQNELDELLDSGILRAELVTALKSIRTRIASDYRAYERVLNDLSYYDTLLAELAYLAPKRKKKS